MHHANVYTDCSINSKKTVCAISIRIVTKKYTDFFTFAQQDVIGCPEIEAVATALYYIKKERPYITKINVFTDYKALVTHLNGGNVTFRKIPDIDNIGMIKNLVSTFDYFHIKWIKGHVSQQAWKEAINNNDRHRFEFIKVDKEARTAMRELNKQVNAIA